MKAPLLAFWIFTWILKLQKTMASSEYWAPNRRGIIVAHMISKVTRFVLAVFSTTALTALLRTPKPGTLDPKPFLGDSDAEHRTLWTPWRTSAGDFKLGATLGTRAAQATLLRV